LVLTQFKFFNNTEFWFSTKAFFLFLTFISLLSACSPVSNRALTKSFSALENKLHDHTGFMLYDPELKKEIYAYQASQYFTTASNTKIFTFYSSLILLGDSIPALQYVERGDSIIIRGTGDPSFLSTETYDTRVAYDFLKNHSKSIYLVADRFFTTPLGSGWSWDDATSAYSAERSEFPIYSNFFTVEKSGNMVKTIPTYFAKQLEFKEAREQWNVKRDIGTNTVYVYPGRSISKEKWEISFKTSAELSAALLADTLKKEVTLINKNFPTNSFKTLYSTPADSLYSVMMQESDNFIAEQLLLMCSAILSDSLKPEIAINYITKNHLSDLPDAPRWVDGSGLSRYNLATPRSIVTLWTKIDQLIPRERLFKLLAIGGKSGTLKNYFKNDSPYIYGKTGTLRNNYSLSGYLITKKGRTLIFSFMNNNYVTPVNEVRLEMEKILKNIYNHY
jgi:D-alanyl-D-alanine carboxypeptidase/D-alanyl-D-alanine-endopeptidase (penicillin-binding protein 4)